ncbi:MAG: DUF2715 domain-containing protein [Flavipsychrobacter sp.]
MKKLFTSFLLLATTMTLQAQEFYLKAGVGYAFPHAGQAVTESGIPYSGKAQYVSGSTTPATFEAKKISFAPSVPVSIGAGYFFTKNIGLEVNVIIGAGTKEHTSSITFPSSTQAGINITQVQNLKAATPILAAPSLVLRSKGQKAYIYTRAGIVLPISVRIKETFTQTHTHIASTAKTKYEGAYETKTMFSIGYSGALGASLKVVEKVRVFGELALQSMSVYAKERELTSLTQGGANVIGQVLPSARVTTYKRNSNTGGNDISFAYPFSNFGFNVGLSMDLN